MLLPMLDITKPICTRDGRASRLLETGCSYTIGGYLYPLKAEVEHPNCPGEWVSWHYMLNGQWKSNDINNPNDLINVNVH